MGYTSKQNKGTTKAATKPAADNLALKTESRIEAYKQSMFDAVTAETEMLTVWYARFFESHSKAAKRDANIKTSNPEAFENAAAAWERARELFNTLTPVVLHELMQDIAAQVKAEFTGRNEIASADVSAEIRTVNLIELSRYEDK